MTTIPDSAPRPATLPSPEDGGFPAITGKRIVYGNEWFRLCEKTVRFSPNEAEQHYCAIEEGDHVSVLVRNTEGLFLLIRQYRPAVEESILELPGGHAEEDGPRNSAWREVVEETGHEPESLTYLGKIIIDSGRNCGYLHGYFADGAKRVATPEPGIALCPVDADALRRLIVQGALSHSLNLSVVLLAMLHGHL